jgi:hypothetical protein
MLELDRIPLDPRLRRLLRVAISGVFVAIVGVLLGFLSELSGFSWGGTPAFVLTVGGVGVVFFAGAIGRAVAIWAMIRRTRGDPTS